jgi:putative Mn2+ efflux pump MntP
VASHRRLRRPLDVTLALVLLLNTTAVGIALGAYGSRLLASVALHGPLELAAFSLAGGAYLAARAGELGAGRLAIAAGLAVVLVAAGAVAETYVQIGAAR